MIPITDVKIGQVFIWQGDEYIRVEVPKEGVINTNLMNENYVFVVHLEQHRFTYFTYFAQVEISKGEQ